MKKPKNPASHTEARFTDEEAARKHLEETRWPHGPVCPHCGGVERNSRLHGEAHRPGLLFCGDCRTQFSVTVGTVFEDSKVALHKWVYAIHLLCASKKGISSLQLSRVLGVTYKTAWFMSHRIRAAMATEPTGQLGDGGEVEADETYWGKKQTGQGSTGSKHAIFSLVERNGKVRSFHVANVTGKTLKPILQKHVREGVDLMTDDFLVYRSITGDYAHSTVQHSKKEYVRGRVHTNTVEGYFSILKRGLIGTYHNVSEAHLQRYVDEFDFRYNHRQALGVDDEERAHYALRGIEGKRLTYRRVNATA